MIKSGDFIIFDGIKLSIYYLAIYNHIMDLHTICVKLITISCFRNRNTSTKTNKTAVCIFLSSVFFCCNLCVIAIITAVCFCELNDSKL